jgi:DNA-binding beta-propeller fold protein YncE
MLPLVVLSLITAQLADQKHQVGDVVPDGTIVPTGKAVLSAGTIAALPAAVLDCEIVSGEGVAIVKTSNSVGVMSLASGRVLSSAPLSGGASLTGIAVSPDGSLIACSTAGSAIRMFRLVDGKLSEDTPLQLPEAKVGGPCYPCGLRFLDSSRLVLAANRDNSLMVANIDSRRVEARIDVDVAPYALEVEDRNHVLVTCWAAPKTPGAPTATSAGTQVEVDKRGIAIDGSLCSVDLSSASVTQRAVVPLQPTEIALSKDRIYVACANGDVVQVLDRRSLKLLKSIRAGKLSGSAPDSLCLDPHGTLYVSLGGLDRVGAYDLNTSRWRGFLRTAWYPSSVRSTAAGLLVATAKGLGSRSAKTSKHGVYDFTSTVSLVAHPRFDAPLPPEVLDGPARPTVAATAVPARTGEPSLIKHVVYVIKENRTYDQLLGDMTEGNGDPNLTIYGEQVTPNHHEIAREFSLLDNYYCNGILSADGHAWATEANATTFYEHSHGGWTRSYPFGDDPLATSVSGYIWDNALDHGRTVRNFGEFDYASTPNGEGAFDVLAHFREGRSEPFGQSIGVARLRGVSERDFPGWNLAIPDVLRADRFAKRLKELEAAGDMADLTIVYLPQDHTSGGSAGFPTPRAQVADNDLGVGKVLDALSHSRFWADSVTFVEEDDPQDGFDHVDGHRSICLVAGPYVRRHAVVSEFYNQASVIHTIERILGLPPMNLNDAEATLMTACFQDQPDMRPYNAAPNRIPLDEKTKGGDMSTFDLRRPDSVDDDLFNRRLWALAGRTGHYPSGRTNSKKGR